MLIFVKINLPVNTNASSTDNHHHALLTLILEKGKAKP